ncbi:hypothetical protein ACLOJK_026721 [Asimina triloba]
MHIMLNTMIAKVVLKAPCLGLFPMKDLSHFQNNLLQMNPCELITKGMRRNVILILNTMIAKVVMQAPCLRLYVKLSANESADGKPTNVG